MGGRQLVTLDTLPLKRVLAVEENGTEHLPPEPAQDEKPRILLQRLDFSQSFGNGEKKAKSTKESIGPSTSLWPWQDLVQHLQQAQQELSIILDFLTHVETNDAVTVATMVKPKPLPHEACSDLSLRVSVKLDCFKKVGKYLKQTAKSLEHQVNREAIFYGALIRLQRNWKVKRLRSISAGPGGSAGFSIDLSYPVSMDITSGSSARTVSLYTVSIDQDSTGLLTAHMPGHRIRALKLYFGGQYGTLYAVRNRSSKDHCIIPSVSQSNKTAEKTAIELEQTKSSEKGVGEGVDEGSTVAHSVLRCIQAAIFDEQVYEWVLREALQPSSGVIVTGISDNGLRLSLGESCTLVLELVNVQEQRSYQGAADTQLKETDHDVSMHTDLENVTCVQENHVNDKVERISDEKQASREIPQINKQILADWGSFPHEACSVVCLQEAFFHSVLMHPQVQDVSRSMSKSGSAKVLEGSTTLNKPKDSGSWAGSGGRDSTSTDAAGALKNFCAVMQHKICSFKVLSELEKLVKGVPHLCLFFHPMWQSRATSWELRLDIPQTVMLGWKLRQASWISGKQKSRSRFHCTIVIHDASVWVECFELVQTQGSCKDERQMSKYSCSLSELPGFLLYQIAGHLITWLHEEGLAMGLKVRRDLLSIYFHLNSQDDFAIVASLDVKAYCINWLLHSTVIIEDGSKEDFVSAPSHCRRFLGPLPLETLRGIVVDLLNLCVDDS